MLPRSVLIPAVAKQQATMAGQEAVQDFLATYALLELGNRPDESWAERLGGESRWIVRRAVRPYRAQFLCRDTQRGATDTDIGPELRTEGLR